MIQFHINLNTKSKKEQKIVIISRHVKVLTLSTLIYLIQTSMKKKSLYYAIITEFHPSIQIHSQLKNSGYLITSSILHCHSLHHLSQVRDQLFFLLLQLHQNQPSSFSFLQTYDPTNKLSSELHSNLSRHS